MDRYHQWFDILWDALALAFYVFVAFIIIVGRIIIAVFVLLQFAFLFGATYHYWVYVRPEKRRRRFMVEMRMKAGAALDMENQPCLKDGGLEEAMRKEYVTLFWGCGVER